MGGLGSGRRSTVKQPDSREIVIQEMFDVDRIAAVNTKQALAFKLAMSDTIDELLYGGAFRGGKTYLLALVCVAKALTIPGARCILTSYRLKSLKEQLWPIVRQMLPNDVLDGNTRENPTPRAQLKNGSEIIGIAANAPENFRGYNDIVFCGADEANLIPEACFPEIKARFSRPKGSTHRPLLLCTCNPAPGYIKDHFITNVKSPETTKFIQATVYDNTAIDAEEYARIIMESYPSERDQRRYLLGDWTAFDGQVFDQYQPMKHCEAFELDPQRHYTRACGMDYGFRNPTVIAYMAMDAEGRVFVYDEFCQSEALPEVIEEAHSEKVRINRLNEEDAMPEADPSMWQRDKASGVAPAEIFEVGLTNGKQMLLSKANNSYRGIPTLQSLIAQDKLFIHAERCPNIDKAFREFRYRPETNTQQLRGEISEHYDSHMKDYIDAVRYGINKLIPPGKDRIELARERSRSVLGVDGYDPDVYEVDPGWERVGFGWY